MTAQQEPIIPIAYPCGCAHASHEPTGARYRLATCPHHAAQQRQPETLGRSYYAELGTFRDRARPATRHVAELTEALGPIPRARRYLPPALEIGCGISPYVETIRCAGYHYTAVEPSHWAARWMRQHQGAMVLQRDFEGMAPGEFAGPFALVLAAHCLEHMADAPAALAKVAAILEPGGELWAVVPDDSDPLNPDHRWFVTEGSLAKAAELAGLSVLALESRRIIARENFLYLRAVRP